MTGGAGVLATVLAVKEPFEAGPTALLIIALLGIGIILLTRSMLKHLRRVPASFDDDDDDDPPPQDGPPDSEATGPDQDRPPVFPDRPGN